jgi:hypothetical protein
MTMLGVATTRKLTRSGMALPANGERMAIQETTAASASVAPAVKTLMRAVLVMAARTPGRARTRP